MELTTSVVSCNAVDPIPIPVREHTGGKSSRVIKIEPGQNTSPSMHLDMGCFVPCTCATLPEDPLNGAICPLEELIQALGFPPLENNIFLTMENWTPLQVALWSVLRFQLTKKEIC